MKILLRLAWQIQIYHILNSMFEESIRVTFSHYTRMWWSIFFMWIVFSGIRCRKNDFASMKIGNKFNKTQQKIASNSSSFGATNWILIKKNQWKTFDYNFFLKMFWILIGTCRSAITENGKDNEYNPFEHRKVEKSNS